MKTIMAMLLMATCGLAYAAADGDDAVASGHEVYNKYCAKCHGDKADGRGKDSWKYKPSPTNFHIAGAARPYMVEITRKGGKGVGRSEDMPDWGDDLSDAQIQNVVSYLMTLRDYNKQQ